MPTGRPVKGRVLADLRPVAAVALLALGLTACRGRVRAAGPSGSPRRIVSLAPSVTETLFALDLGDRVVGVTRYCDYPPEAASRAKVGGYLDPSYEAIVALQPDLVVVQQDQGDAEARLSSLGLSTLRVDQHDVAGICRSLSDIAAACGVAGRGDALAADIRTRVAGVRRLVAGRPPVRALVVVGREPGSSPIRSVWVAGEQVFYAEVLALAGGRNAYSGSGAQFPEVSREGLIHLDPEVILDVLPEAKRRGLDRERVIGEWRTLPELRAVREGRVILLDDDFMERPGPRVVEMVAAMARALHPEVAWPRS
jgi:iron complex transport system substrate-binding protein